MSNQIEQIRAEIKRRNLANYCGTAEQYEEELFAILDTIEAEKKEHPVPADVQEAADKAAEKAAYKHYPNSPSSGQFGTGDYQPEEDNSLDREVFVKGFKAGLAYERERLASCPTIKGWMARDGYGSLAFSNMKPSRIKLWKLWKVSSDTPAVVLPSTLSPSLRWEDEPREVELLIIIKEEGK